MYKPIDYSHWNFDGSGSNIAAQLNASEREIWRRAFPFQDKRDDKGHAEVATYFALQLLQHIGGDREIVIPAIILHDVGWSQMSEVERALFYDKKWKDYEPVSRARHQEEGVIKSREILNESRHPHGNIEFILEIISGHDTREGFFIDEDGIVRDADKLWRFTLPALDIWINKRGISCDEVRVNLNKDINGPDFFYSEEAKQIARVELENMMSRFLSR